MIPPLTNMSFRRGDEVYSHFIALQQHFLSVAVKQ